MPGRTNELPARSQRGPPHMHEKRLLAMRRIAWDGCSQRPEAAQGSAATGTAGREGSGVARFSASLGVIRRYGGSAVRRYGGTAKGCTVSEGFGAAGLVSAGFGAVLTAVSAGFDRFRRASAHGQAWFLQFFPDMRVVAAHRRGFCRDSSAFCGENAPRQADATRISGKNCPLRPSRAASHAFPAVCSSLRGSRSGQTGTQRRGRARRQLSETPWRSERPFEEGRMPAAPRSTGSAAPQQSAGPFEEG